MTTLRKLTVPLAAFAVGGLCGWGACAWRASRSGDAVAATVPARAARMRPSRPAPAVAPDPAPVFEPAVTYPAAVRSARQPASARTVVEAETDPETGLSMAEARAKFAREHPEAEAARRARFAQQLAAQRAANEARGQFIAAIDEAFFSPAQREGHAAFRSALARANELQARADALRLAHERLPADEARELLGLRDRLRHGAGAERAALLEAAARSAGFEGDAAGDFAELIGSIFETTRETNFR